MRGMTNGEEQRQISQIDIDYIQKGIDDILAS